MSLSRRIAAIFLIFSVTSIAWLGLAGITDQRTRVTRADLRSQVAELYGEEQHVLAPEIFYDSRLSSSTSDMLSSGGDIRHQLGHSLVTVSPESSRIRVDLEADQRKKGLLWYSTYRVGFDGDYTVKNHTDTARYHYIQFTFPTTHAIYDNFVFRVDGKDVPLSSEEGVIGASLYLRPGEEKPFMLAYESRGLNHWSYSLGRGVTQVKNFNLQMSTDFSKINFPPGTISPTDKLETVGGWELVWHHDNLISGFKIGMEMPAPIDPGPLASQITLFAPVTLLFFFFIIFVLSVIRNINLHPMNYFFLACAFFSFHLLFSYLVDHIDLHLAFVISSVTSVGLVVSYLRLVVGSRFAFREAGIAQLIYLVLFSYAHFFQGFTGLTVTIGSILTLAVLMQVTARIDWEKPFSR